MEEFNFYDVLKNISMLKNSHDIPGNINEVGEIEQSSLYDFKTTNKKLREKLNFISRENVNLSGIESDDFKKRLHSWENDEAVNRLYIVNNYRGFGYKKTLEDFETTMTHVLDASIFVKSEETENKEIIISSLQSSMMRLFKDKTLTNEQVMENIKKEISFVEDKFNIKLTENIANNASILINKFRMSLFNMKEGNRYCKYKNELENLHEENLKFLNNKLIQLNSQLPVEDRITIRDVFVNLKGRENLDISFVENLIKKLDETGSTLIRDIELSATNVDKFGKDLSEINKTERLSSLALNYFLAEKNMLINTNKKSNSSLYLDDISDELKVGKIQNTQKDLEQKLKKLSKIMSNSKNLDNYVERVYERINDNDKLNFAISKEELRHAILNCKDMLDEYFKNKNSIGSIGYELDKNISHKIATSSINKNVEADIMEMVSNTLKDNLYNKLIEEKYKDSNQNLYDLKIDIKKNLEDDTYSFNNNKNNDLLSCDNMQKIFSMLNEKTLTPTEALALIQNNRDILKTFSMAERNAVEDLIENISTIKKQELDNKKKKSPYKDYLFENLKSNDADYNPKDEIANFLKRKHIDSILNTGKNNKKTFTKELSNFFSNKYALTELFQCASKQVESRKMDTQLSMASQCMDSYRQKVEQEIKETERNISTVASNPALTMGGFTAFVMLMMIVQKSRLRHENIKMIQNEHDIANCVNHIESVNEQKIKDALAILYKLKNHDGKDNLVVSNITDKETLIDIKKDIFYADLLIKGKEKVTVDGEKIALDEISYKSNNALENFKVIFENFTSNPNLEKEIARELTQIKEQLLKDKRSTFFIDNNNEVNSTNYSIYLKNKEDEYQRITEEFSTAREKHIEAYKVVFPKLKNDMLTIKDINDSIKNVNNIEDKETQKVLRNMLKNMSLLNEDMKQIKNNLESFKNNVKALKREREETHPFIDLVDDNGNIDNEKLSLEIKRNPEKVITMILNLKSINNLDDSPDNNEKKDIKKALLFNIIDRAANKNGSDLNNSDFFNEIMTKVIPYNKNIIEELIDFDFSSKSHPNQDKIILEISSKNEISNIKDQVKDSAKSISNFFLEQVTDLFNSSKNI